MYRASFVAIALGAVLTGGSALAGKAHQHGVAQLDIAFEAGKLSITLDSPLDNLLGFERAPRTDAERKAADAAVARLQAGGGLFAIDPAAQCSLGRAEVVSAVLKVGKAEASAADGHADLEASWEFVCKGTSPAWVDVGLFESFRRLTQLDVQTVGGKGQGKSTLKRPARRVTLPR